VQHIIRPYNNNYHDYRGYAGRVAGGILKLGDDVIALPSGFTSKIVKIDTFDGPIEEAFPPMSVTILLEDDIDISRGDMIVRVNNQPRITQDLEVMLCWFDHNKPLQPRGKYAIRHTTQEARCIISEVRYKLDINTLHRNLDDTGLHMNDMGRVLLRTTKPLFIDAYKNNRITGSIILIDEGSNSTVAAGMII
jgi:sulfate adenylyltransferase subunit 1